MSTERFWAIIPAAGIGSRFSTGSDCSANNYTGPKQYAQIQGKTLLEHAADSLLAHADLAGLMIALHPDDTVANTLPLVCDSRVHFCVGGRERADSVFAALTALAAMADADDWVLVHDAARPGLTQAALARLLDARANSDAAILALPAVDTLKRGVDGAIIETVDRAQIWQAQTPQQARLGVLQSALTDALSAGAAITDEASALERLGIKVALVVGERANFKVTYFDELALAAFYLQAQSASN